MEAQQKNLRDVNNEFEEFYSSISGVGPKKKIRDAYEFAKRAHLYQKRDSGEPYISHPLYVAKIVYEQGTDIQSIVSAFLHDVVEDTDVTVGDIEVNFSKEIALIVDGLTKITDFGREREDRQIDTLRKVLLASSKDMRVLVIKLCDRLHNLRTIEEISGVYKRERIADETLQIYVPIAQKIGMYSLKWELEDLAFKFKDPDMYQLIRDKVGLKRREREEIVQKSELEIKNMLNETGIKDFIVLGRPKNFFSIYKKIRTKAKSFEDIYDLYAVRIIVDSVSDCYTILGFLHDKFQSFPDKLKDYIANPKANGYQSIHTVIFSRAINSPVEIQIRTSKMHKLAEFGIAAHWRYKDVKEDKRFERKIAWLREILQWENEHKDNREFLKLLKYDFFEDEIFVFTPKNDIKVLPEDSSALDFAYAVHTDIGSKAYKAKINGYVTNIDKRLNSGDIVEIVTHKSVIPREKWLRHVKTSKARIKIRASLNLKHSGKRRGEDGEVSFKDLKSKILGTDEFKKIRNAGCCDIEYGNQIVGVVRVGKELVVHDAGCENAKYTVNKKFPLRWVESEDKEIVLRILLKARFGILVDILDIMSRFNVVIKELNTKFNKDGSVNMEMRILDGPYKETLIHEIDKLDIVESVRELTGIFFKT